MRYLDEYRAREGVERLTQEIARTATRPWVIMEVCGGQTHAIVRYGVDEMLPKEVELVHGPGCPVCVTPLETIDLAHAIARQADVIFCSFGDMLRVPGSAGDLFSLRALGADVRIVYSPLDALAIAERNPARQVVFFAVGFETTAPANALAVAEAHRRGVSNFSVLVSHVLVPPALEYILRAPGNRVQAFLGPGHVCTVVGTGAYEAVAQKHRVPVVVTGFEPLDLLEGILYAVRQLEAARADLEVQYSRAVRREGNPSARALVDEVFEVIDRRWRGIGAIAESGLGLRLRYRAFDAEHRFVVPARSSEPESVCISGAILMGLKKPRECPAFGRGCSPERPLGVTMVSSEGACAAYYPTLSPPEERGDFQRTDLEGPVPTV